MLPGTRRQTAAIVFNNQHQPFILLPALQGDRAGISMFHNVVQPFLADTKQRHALVEQALNAGARGFLSKRCSPDELIAAVHTVATGGCYLTPDIAIKLASGRQDPLTKRERQVAEKLAQGMAVKEIAAELGLSPKTVHVHRANLMEKLGVSNDVELARRMFDGW